MSLSARFVKGRARNLYGRYTGVVRAPIRSGGLEARRRF
jgi:hypothetical protein